MGVSSKMAAWMKKQMKDIPAGSSKAEVKEEMQAIEMTKLSKAELNEISKGKGSRAMSAEDELDRRQLKRDIKSGREGKGQYSAGAEPVTPDMHREWRKRQNEGALDKKQEKAADKRAEDFAMGKEMEESKPTKKLSPAEKKDLEESLKFKKGGLVKKKPVAAKAKAPAAKSRTNALNKYYGK